MTFSREIFSRSGAEGALGEDLQILLTKYHTVRMLLEQGVRMDNTANGYPHYTFSAVAGSSSFQGYFIFDKDDGLVKILTDENQPDENQQVTQGDFNVRSEDGKVDFLLRLSNGRVHALGNKRGVNFQAVERRLSADEQRQFFQFMSEMAAPPTFQTGIKENGKIELSAKLLEALGVRVGEDLLLAPGLDQVVMGKNLRDLGSFFVRVEPIGNGDGEVFFSIVGF